PASTSPPVIPHYAAPRHLHSFPTRRSSDLHQGPRPAKRPPTGAPPPAASAIAAPMCTVFPAPPSLQPKPQHKRHERPGAAAARSDRKSTRLNSSHVKISYAVFCLKKKHAVT